MQLAVLLLGAVFAAIPGDNSQQDSQPQASAPRPYVEQGVTYQNANALNVRLSGTFTKPANGGPFPAVLLVPGAGPNDRDETTAGHKPFLVIADYLARRGIAVLRVDSRGTGKSTGDFETATTKDLASDAEASVSYLLSRDDVDEKHVGLIGHGEGAIVAPMVARDMPQIAFLVLLAPTAVPGEQVLLTQTERAEKAAGLPREQIKADKKIGTVLYDMVREGRPEPDLRQALLRFGDDYEPFLDRWKAQLHRLESPWLKFFLSYNPAPTLEKLKCPVLALEGEKDLQVIPDQNVPAVKAALAHNPDATVILFPGLNYMFQTASTGVPWEYATIRETISPVVLNTIGAWITKHVSQSY